MKPEALPYSCSFEVATLLEFVKDHGLELLTIDSLARALGRSRSSVFSQFHGRHGMLAYAHQGLVYGLNRVFDYEPGDRRFEFENWWAEIVELMRHPYGRAFRLIRTVVGVHEGLEIVARWEAEQLEVLRRWVSRAQLTTGQTVRSGTLACWLMVLSASSYDAGSQDEVAARELAWSIVGGEAIDTASEVSIAPIGDPLPSLTH